MRDAFLSLDLDFFCTPPIHGSGYGTMEYISIEDQKARMKKNIQFDSFRKKVKLEKPIRGTINRDESATLNTIEKLLADGYLKKGEFDYFHFDSHHDMYLYHEDDYYHNLDIVEYRPWEHLYYLVEKKIIKSFFWIYPDYLKDFPQLLDTSRIDDKIDIMKQPFSAFSNVMYNWKYFNIVSYERTHTLNSDEKGEIMKYIIKF